MSNNTLIELKLRQIEQEREIKILFATEVGSRTWGTSGEFSDHDIKIVYLPKNLKKTVSLFNNIENNFSEKSADLEFEGWTLAKFIGLFAKSSASTYEWCHSPIVFRGDTIRTIFADMTEAFNLKNAYNHYLGLATGNYKKYICDKERKDVSPKKAVHVLRSYFSAYFIAKYQRLPPLDCNKLLSIISLDYDRTILIAVTNAIECKLTDTPLGRGTLKIITDLLDTKPAPIIWADLTHPDKALLDEIWFHLTGIDRCLGIKGIDR